MYIERKSSVYVIGRELNNKQHYLTEMNETHFKYANARG